MFQKGELIFYNNSGACRVEAVGPLEGARGADRERSYYKLSLLHGGGTIDVYKRQSRGPTMHGTMFCAPHCLCRIRFTVRPGRGNSASAAPPQLTRRGGFLGGAGENRIKKYF